MGCRSHMATHDRRHNPVLLMFAVYLDFRYDHVGVVVREGDGSLKLIDAGFNGECC